MPLKEQACGHEPEEGNSGVKCFPVAEHNVHDSFYQNIRIMGAAGIISILV